MKKRRNDIQCVTGYRYRKYNPVKGEGNGVRESGGGGGSVLVWEVGNEEAGREYGVGWVVEFV